MAINDITLAGGLRRGLNNLKLTAALQARTFDRLSTGLKVNSAVDDPSAFFAAQNHRARANDLSVRKAAMGEALQTVEAADAGITAITSLIEQAKGILSDARSGDTTTRASLAADFDAIRTQIDDLAGDASYKGTNLLAAASSLVVAFNEDGSSALTITGFDGSSTGLAISAAVGAFATDANIDAASADLDTALGTLRTQSASLASNNGTIATRESFTTNLINTLTTGADNLTVADLNEEGANLLALQTRQQLGIVALSLSSQAQQSILSIF